MKLIQQEATPDLKQSVDLILRCPRCDRFTYRVDDNWGISKKLTKL